MQTNYNLLKSSTISGDTARVRDVRKEGPSRPGGTDRNDIPNPTRRNDNQKFQYLPDSDQAALSNFPKTQFDIRTNAVLGLERRRVTPSTTFRSILPWIVRKSIGSARSFPGIIAAKHSKALPDRILIQMGK
jgi:hypothetical protein